MLQINVVMLGELASPGVRHSRVQQNTSGLPDASTSMRGDPPFIHVPVVILTTGGQLQPNRRVTSIRLGACFAGTERRADSGQRS